ncbi:hypothetical protein OG559_06025 [Micromonospora sp. NBC_01405]|uniref:hypothetical protein n=1 Tax=Micromonospora sp. NBC_01405 TaxID=2903589 RepID=UPI0032490A67
MDPWAWQEIIAVIGLFALMIIVLAVTIREVGKTLRARAALARDRDYRELADRSITAQELTGGRLTEVETRLAAIERILKDVE